MLGQKRSMLIPSAIILNVLLTVSAAFAQKPADSPAPALAKISSSSAAAPKQNAAPVANPADIPADQYRIGPGDVLDIQVLNRPNISKDAVRVEGNGTIRMPLIEGAIPAACMTETELAQSLTKRYLKYYRNPQVDVFIKEFKSSQVAVIGHVNEQGRFLLQRRIRLLELLSYAKGPATNAGQTINVIHSPTAQRCEAQASDETQATGIATYKLSDTLMGVEQANPYLESGDIVTLREADRVYVVGDVLAPREIPLKEPITISRAIAMAGGLGKDSKKDKIRVIRQAPGSASKTEIFADLGAIERKKAEDIELLANDIVDVPTSGAKSLMRSLMGTIAPAVSQMPIRVIP
ncbi:MAG TPA: polysaccharide biosynthesis/export family protein [Pyrinomonadaceae bacterium]|nr:polysaccharide biosynthesis/export family protein [Pyrinomonadaceae bacterium]